MDFTTLQARVAGETGLDTTTDATIIKAWINAAYKKINGVANWPWLVKNSTIQTVADITTGTVSINAGSTSLTFSSGPAQSVANQYMIQIPTITADWYLISAHSAASTSATLNVPLVGSTNASGAAYILRKVLYSMPSDLDRIISVRQSITKQELVPIDVRRFDRELPDPSAVANPIAYAAVGLDSSKYWQITLYPIPSAVINLQTRYFLVPADMSTGSDTPILPERFHDALIFGALYLYGHSYIDDSRFQEAQTRYKDSIQYMKDNYNPIPDQGVVLQPWDTRARRTTGAVQWPANYPEVWRT